MTNLLARSTRLAAIALAAALVAACETIGVATPDPDRMFAERIEAGRAAWAEQGVDDYVFTVRYGCFCPDTVTGPFTVTVRDGVATDVRRLDGRVVDDPGGLQAPTTIDGVFEAAVRALEGDEASLAFDPAWGFPTEVTADPIENAADDEWSVTVTDFAPAP